MAIAASLTLLFFALAQQAFESITPAVRRDLEHKALSGASELRYRGDQALLMGNGEQLRAAAQRYIVDPDVRSVRFLDTRGRAVFSHGEQPGAAEELTTVAPGALLDRAGFFGVWEPLTVEGLAAGRVELFVSQDRLRAGMRLHRQVLLGGLIGALVSLLGAFAFVNAYIMPAVVRSDRALARSAEETAQAVANASARSETLATMSHELRTPLNAILGMVQLARRAPDSPRALDYLATIEQAGRALLGIVNDVLDFSKLESGRFRLSPRRTPLEAIFKDTVVLLGPAARRKGLDLQLDYDPTLPHSALLDPGRLRQVLINLVGNAIKFTHAGHVRVRAAARGGDAASTQSLLVEVLDTGIGVPEQARRVLFEAFTQVDEGSAGSREGTGLGLAITAQLVGLMGGRVEVAARKPAGSSFSFTIPLPTVDGEPSGARPRDEPCPSSTLLRPARILIVDDHALNRLVSREMLEGLGFNVDEAENGQCALELVETHGYAAILMDCEMPDLDGYEVSRRIRALEGADAQLVIIACTGHALEGERARFEAAGMDDYVGKPIDLGELERVLWRWLPGRRGVEGPAHAAGETPGSVR